MPEFEEWKRREIHQGAEVFIRDGVIDRGKWGLPRPKLKTLFLLKEAYSGSEDWDLRTYLRKGPKGNMWNQVAQWSYGLQELARTGEVAPFPGDKQKAAVVDAFLSAAAVNLKKSGGKSESDDSDLRKYVESDWDLLLQQIHDLAPDLVICGFTYPIFRDRLRAPKKRGEWIYRANGLTFVDFWHPANHYPHKLNYYSICTAVRLSGVLANVGS
tara:strand:- start:9026 stop:9667 length:642 start_codon:yes stop_codon:yes gene_type:complete